MKNILEIIQGIVNREREHITPGPRDRQDETLELLIVSSLI